MAVVTPLLTQMLIDNIVARPAKQAVLPKKEDVVLSALVLLLLGCAAVFALVALDLHLATIYAPALAALLTAAAALGAAGVLTGGLLLARHLRRKKRAAALPSSDQAKDALLAALESATQGLEEPIANNPRTSVFLASLAGYMAGEKLH